MTIFDNRPDGDEPVRPVWNFRRRTPTSYTIAIFLASAIATAAVTAIVNHVIDDSFEKAKHQAHVTTNL